MGKRSREDAHGATQEPGDDVNAAPVKKVKKEKSEKGKEVRRLAKAARKAEKEKRKADRAKRRAEKSRENALRNRSRAAAEKLEAAGTDTAESIANPSLDSSVAPSKGTSSATSPEADPTRTLPQKIPEEASAYSEDAALSALPQADIDAFLSTHHITIADPLSQSLTLRPITQFSHLPINDESLKAPFASFKSPTPIQAAAWPSLFAGRDVIGVAETGSGKTLAFGVPCVVHILSLEKKKGPGAVIVSPTRELALQIQDQLSSLAKIKGLTVSCIYGGVPKDDQRVALKKSNIIVATPGRLNDLLGEEGASSSLKKAKYLVLDEADRMLDKGFEEDIRKIVASTAPADKRQTLMFTATWPPSVRELAATFMKSPVRISIGEDNPNGELRANTRIAQTVEVVDPRAKETRLLQLLKQNLAGKMKDDRILVFCLYKKEATRVEEFIRSRGFRVAGIHGDLSQAQRIASLDAFKTGKVPLLVATDVAARGLDIPAVKLVINVTFPLTAEDYVHRIGRTGRAGKEGRAITLFTEHDKALSGALINVMKAAGQPVPAELMKFGTTVKKKAHDAYGAFYKDPGDMKKPTRITFDD
ncbi:DEAD-domain-containing protein [Rhizodiscina lignyota]|uniref:RNA helicase n=1 Tax=Rhizodiscina lignyota TaxID=1504668 RepID=A0A9P4M8Z1_9PEZI|nr:DEAD-domain-containing protein [Rhizodiscina lignyota]